MAKTLEPLYDTPYVIVRSCIIIKKTVTADCSGVGII